MRPNRNGKRVPPGDGGYDVEVGEVTGAPVYHVPVPPAKSRGPLVPVDVAASDKARTPEPLVVGPDEVAALPKLAQRAFIERCGQRVPPGSLDPTTHIATGVAHYLFVTATTDTPLTAQLRCIRRDFKRLRTLARKQNWADDTPVLPDVFGPLWPEGVAPSWAAEPQKG